MEAGEAPTASLLQQLCWADMGVTTMRAQRWGNSSPPCFSPRLLGFCFFFMNGSVTTIVCKCGHNRLQLLMSTCSRVGDANAFVVIIGSDVERWQRCVCSPLAVLQDGHHHLHSQSSCYHGQTWSADCALLIQGPIPGRLLTMSATIPIRQLHLTENVS